MPIPYNKNNDLFAIIGRFVGKRKGYITLLLPFPSIPVGFHKPQIAHKDTIIAVYQKPSISASFFF
jgi:hypothetical protein